MTEVKDAKDKSRFELDEGGGVSFADYARGRGEIAILHVETPPALRGQGIAARLMDGIVTIARAEGAQIRPICPYAVAYLKRRRDVGDVVAG
ncbi:MAG: N-acetyltransferase [Alphaproteobacteria bacterium]|nr:N-acetyltransferase [Alphaproteobacteria bacterium]